MSSKSPFDLPDLDRDLVTTPEDIRALRAHRLHSPLPWWEQLQILHDLIPDAHEQLRRRRRLRTGPVEL
jgi:hypothetical protein